MQLRRSVVHVCAAVALAVTARDARGQAAPNKVGYTAKTMLAKARAEAKKARSDAYLFQIVTTGSTNGIDMWDYDFYSPGAGEKKCVRVSMGRGDNPSVSLHKCPGPAEMELKEFTIDSDKVVVVGRAAGVKGNDLTVALRMSDWRGAELPIWSIIEGTKPGDLMVDFDGMTGALLHKATFR